MAMIKPESKMLDEVRRWRREAFEERSRQSMEERIAEDRRLASELGLRMLDESELTKPQIPSPVRKAG